MALRILFFILVVIAGANVGIDKHRQQLPALDQLWISGIHFVGLDIEQKPTLSEDVVRVDDPRRFFILGYESLLLGLVGSKKFGLCWAT